MNENLYSILLRAPKNLGQNDSSYLFQAFLMNVSKLAGESMIKNLSQLRSEKFLGLVLVVLMMTIFVDEMKLRNRNCLCLESSTSNLKLRKTLWLATCPKWIADTDQYFDLQSLLRMHQRSLAVVPV